MRVRVKEAPVSQDPPTQPTLDTTVCQLCRQRPIATAITNLPVCEPCRELLIRRPFPTWIKLVATVVLVLMLVAFVRGLKTFDAAMELERGQRNEQANQYAAAMYHYEMAEKDFPGSPKIGLLMAHCALRLDQPRRAAEIMVRLNGMRVEGAEALQAGEIERQLVGSGYLKETPAR